MQKHRVAEFRLTPIAHKDLKNIAAYTLKTWARDQVETYVSALTHRMQWLADNPELGRPRDYIARDYKCFPEGQHLIFFVMKQDHIAIIGVPHSSMDVGTTFNENSIWRNERLKIAAYADVAMLQLQSALLLSKPQNNAAK